MVRARTVAPIGSVQDRTGYLRAQLMRDEPSGDYLVRVLGTPGASPRLLASLAEANSLVVVEPEVTMIGTGDYVDVAFLAQRS